MTWNLTVTGTLWQCLLFLSDLGGHTRTSSLRSLYRRSSELARRGSNSERRRERWHSSSFFTCSPPFLIVHHCAVVIDERRVGRRQTPGGSLRFHSYKNGRTLFFASTSDCHSFNLSACHKKTVNSGQIHKALSHIDPHGALFSCIGNTIDLGLSAAANILLPWSIVFFFNNVSHWSVWLLSKLINYFNPFILWRIK